MCPFVHPVDDSWVHPFLWLLNVSFTFSIWTATSCMSVCLRETTHNTSSTTADPMWPSHYSCHTTYTCDFLPPPPECFSTAWHLINNVPLLISEWPLTARNPALLSAPSLPLISRSPSLLSLSVRILPAAGLTISNQGRDHTEAHTHTGCQTHTQTHTCTHTHAK